MPTKKTRTESPAPVVTKDDLDRAHGAALAALHSGDAADMNLHIMWTEASRAAKRETSADPLLKYQEYVRDTDERLKRIKGNLEEALTVLVVRHLCVTCGHDVIALWGTHATYHEACLDGLIFTLLRIVDLDMALSYDRPIILDKINKILTPQPPTTVWLDTIEAGVNREYGLAVAAFDNNTTSGYTLTVSAAGRMFAKAMKDLEVTVKSPDSRISKACDAEAILCQGTGRDRRINEASLKAWIYDQTTKLADKDPHEKEIESTRPELPKSFRHNKLSGTIPL
jgi:hypothetical protein